MNIALTVHDYHDDEGDYILAQKWVDSVVIPVVGDLINVVASSGGVTRGVVERREIEYRPSGTTRVSVWIAQIKEGE